MIDPRSLVAMAARLEDHPNAGDASTGSSNQDDSGFGLQGNQPEDLTQELLSWPADVTTGASQIATSYNGPDDVDELGNMYGMSLSATTRTAANSSTGALPPDRTDMAHDSGVRRSGEFWDQHMPPRLPCFNSEAIGQREGSKGISIPQLSSAMSSHGPSPPARWSAAAEFSSGRADVPVFMALPAETPGEPWARPQTPSRQSAMPHVGGQPSGTLGVQERVKAMQDVVIRCRATGTGGRPGRLPRRLDPASAREMEHLFGIHPVTAVQRAHERFVRLLLSSSGPDRQSFSAALHANLAAGEIELATFWLSWMLGAGFAMGPSTLDSVAQLFTDLWSQQQLLDNMAAMGVSPNDHSWNQLIHACVKAGNLERAEEFLTTLINSQTTPFQASVISYNTVIHAHCHAGDASRAEFWLQKMLEVNIMPMVSTLGAVINAFAELGALENAEHWFALMVERGWFSPNEYIFNGMIKASTNAGDMARAAAWFERMKEADVPVTAVTYNTMIHACGQVRDINGAERYFTQLLHSGEEVNVITYNAMINVCATCGRRKRAELWVERMQEANVEPDTVTYGTLCKALAHEGQHSKIEEIIDSLDSKGITHNEYFYASWINACSRARHPDPKEAERAFRQCIARGLDWKGTRPEQ